MNFPLVDFICLAATTTDTWSMAVQMCLCIQLRLRLTLVVLLFSIIFFFLFKFICVAKNWHPLPLHTTHYAYTVHDNAFHWKFTPTKSNDKKRAEARRRKGKKKMICEIDVIQCALKCEHDTCHTYKSDGHHMRLCQCRQRRRSICNNVNLRARFQMQWRAHLKVCCITERVSIAEKLLWFT